MDFTIHKYQQLLDALKDSGITFKLRHDVDLKPLNSLCTAKIEHSKGLSATYYFRCVPESYDKEIILEIAKLGHEIGYHYESLTTCHGDIDAAYKDFTQNLQLLRQLAPIHSICMHGSPRSPWDSRDLWKRYDYRSLGIDHEPYFDTDFSKTLYLTDTGRRWDGFYVSLRDKIPQYQELWEKQGLVFHTTNPSISQLQEPQSVLRQSGLSLLITTHPQRWNPVGLKHLMEYGSQGIKNIVKQIMVQHNNKNNNRGNN